ncbi:SDR family NAD(P)-dependent oxidoreductase [Oligoflexaceae bacterium]|nr:SDR family NAD(P)-dependent oxidoreductase [Oligoflexaceae bacterium]
MLSQKLIAVILFSIISSGLFGAEGPVVLVTGAFKGLGVRVVHQLQAQGFRVVATGRDVEAAKENGLVESENLRVLSLDVTDSKQSQQVVNQVKAEWGSIYGLVHNAAKILVAPTDLVSVEQLEYISRVNYLGPAALTQMVLPDMKQQGKGRVVFVSSSAAILNTPEFAAYSASKSAGESYFQTLSGELKQSKSPVSSSVIRIGFVRSQYEPKVEIIGHDQAESESQSKFMSQLRSLSPTTDRSVAKGITSLIKSKRPPKLINFGIDGKLLSAFTYLPNRIQDRCMKLTEGFFRLKAVSRILP